MIQFTLFGKILAVLFFIASSICIGIMLGGTIGLVIAIFAVIIVLGLLFLALNL